MLDEADTERKYRDYVAVTQTNIMKLLSSYLGAELKMPEYFDFMYPDAKEKQKEEDKGIIDGLIKKLLSPAKG